jgi:hypothetical protein
VQIKVRSGGTYHAADTGVGDVENGKPAADMMRFAFGMLNPQGQVESDTHLYSVVTMM